jgi:hypothetical protein
MERVPLYLSFHKYLAGNTLALWNDLVLRFAQVQLRDQNDVFK